MENDQVHELIGLVRDFSCPETVRTQAFDKLLEEFQFLLYAVTNHFYCSKKNRGISFQQVFKDAQSIFYGRVLVWDSKKKACFRHYISYAIFQYLDNLYSGFFPRSKRNCTVHLNEDFTDSIQICEQHGSFSEVCKYLEKTYGELLAFIFIKYYEEGYTQSEIAAMINRSQFWVCMSLKHIIKDLREAFTEDAFINKFFI